LIEDFLEDVLKNKFDQTKRREKEESEIESETKVMHRTTCVKDDACDKWMAEDKKLVTTTTTHATITTPQIAKQNKKWLLTEKVFGFTEMEGHKLHHCCHTEIISLQWWRRCTPTEKLSQWTTEEMIVQLHHTVKHNHPTP
jgi:hypothetical protein